jgi:hypothetical protein
LEVRVLPGPPIQFNALWAISHITDLEEFQNGNDDGNILHNWALLTNRSRVVAFRDEAFDSSDIAIAAQARECTDNDSAVAAERESKGFRWKRKKSAEVS